MITAFNKDTGHTVTRNISFFKVIPVIAKAPSARITIEDEEGEHRLSQVSQETTQQPREARQATPGKVYPKCIRRDISEWQKY